MVADLINLLKNLPLNKQVCMVYFTANLYITRKSSGLNIVCDAPEFKINLSPELFAAHYDSTKKTLRDSNVVKLGWPIQLCDHPSNQRLWSPSIK